MTLTTWALDPVLLDYLRAVSLREPSPLQHLRQSTANHPQQHMQMAPEQSQLLALLVQLMNVRRALELGVFLGYSGLAIALALPPDGCLVACEVNPSYGAIARQHWQQAGVADKIELQIAPALDTLDRLLTEGQRESFDFILIDADKRNYQAYYERSLLLLRRGGLIALDNTLWYGQVADPALQDRRTAALRALNQHLHCDPRIALSLLPIGDGLTLALKL